MMCTLARLSFWVPPERMDTFESTYKKKVVPILKKHDLVESSEPGRSIVEGVFSRLFEVETPGEVVAREKALARDSAWQKVLRDLGSTLRTTEPDALIRHRFGVYAAPAGPGKHVEVGPGFRQGLWQSFGPQDGFPSSRVWDMLEDRGGRLWFATGGKGVVCYDGAQFAVSDMDDGLAGNNVSSVLEDRAGNLWFGTLGGGVTRYDGEQFTTFTTEDGLGDDNVWCLLQDREGNLWLGTWQGGVSRYNGEHFVTFTAEEGLASNKIRCIAEDREGNLWAGTDASGVSRYDRERFITLTIQDGLASNSMFSILQDGQGYLWFGTQGEGVSRYDGEEFTTFTTKEGLAHDWVTCILETRESHLWLGSYGGGVTRYDGARFTTFTTDSGLVNNQVFSLMEDHEGYLWFGTWGGGVSRYDGVQFTIFDTKAGLVDNGVMSLVQDREDRLWFGTWGGVSVYDGVELKTLDGLEGRKINVAFEDGRGRLWFGTEGDGVSCCDGKKLVTFTTKDGLVDNSVRSIAEDRVGNLWFGTGQVGSVKGGVSRYDGTYFTTEGRLPRDEVRPIIEDREGNVWVGTVRQGAYRYDGREFLNFTNRDGLCADGVEAILEDRAGHLWFGTHSGVSRYDGREFVSFTTEDGLAYDDVVSILEDREGRLWFGTHGGGVNIYDGLAFQSLSRKDGLVNDAVEDILQDRNGGMWIATEGGITRYRPHSTPPSVQLKQIIADRTYGPLKEMHIPASQQFVIFQFQGKSLTTRPDGMVYVVRLEGYEPDWRPMYTGQVEYRDLPLGEYAFQVKAVDRDLNYSEPAKVRIIVEPDPRLEALTEALRESGPTGEFVGESDALRRVQMQLRELAPTDLTVLILGETGTGKGLATRTLYEWSTRANGPFIQVHCGAIPEALVESELFGHEKGAFTGAVARKLGKVELAQGGTLFLDEIGDMALQSQVKLLRLLEERTFERVGGTETLSADVRVVAATNRDLERMVAEDTFRGDLYFRLRVFPLHMPPVRERRDDIPLLAAYFLKRKAGHLGKEIEHFTEEALTVLQAHNWPGNVRELEHVVQRAVIVCSGSAIQAGDITLGLGKTEEGLAEERLTLEEVERRYIREVLEEMRWVIKGPHGAAARLGLNYGTLRSRMKKLGIQRP